MRRYESSAAGQLLRRPQHRRSAKDRTGALRHVNIVHLALARRFFISHHQLSGQYLSRDFFWENSVILQYFCSIVYFLKELKFPHRFRLQNVLGVRNGQTLKCVKYSSEISQRSHSVRVGNSFKRFHLYTKLYEQDFIYFRI